MLTLGSPGALATHARMRSCAAGWSARSFTSKYRSNVRGTPDDVAEATGAGASGSGSAGTHPGGGGGAARTALAIRMAHREVQQEAQGRLREMGSTLAALHVHDSKVLIAHVGDSRVYRIRDGHIEQMTRDHSLTADLEAAGCESMLAHLPPHYRHMVTRVIAANANAQPDFRVVDAQAGDTFVLCSDGVHDVLGGDAILDAVDDAECEEASERVVARAFAEGTQDNITVVVVRV